MHWPGYTTDYVPCPAGPTSVVSGSTVRASAADQQHETSLPSTETSGASPKEHVGGTGALPGHVSEEAVTKLPDERSVKGDSGK